MANICYVIAMHTTVCVKSRAHLNTHEYKEDPFALGLAIGR